MIVSILVVATWVVDIMYDDVCKFLNGTQPPFKIM